MTLDKDTDDLSIAWEDGYRAGMEETTGATSLELANAFEAGKLWERSDMSMTLAALVSVLTFAILIVIYFTIFPYCGR